MQIFPIATKQAPYIETEKSHKNNSNLHLQIINFLIFLKIVQLL